MIELHVNRSYSYDDVTVVVGEEKIELGLLDEGEKLDLLKDLLISAEEILPLCEFGDKLRNLIERIPDDASELK